MAKRDPHLEAHLEWLAYVQPIGLVVSAQALSNAGAILERNDIEGQQRLRALVEERRRTPAEEPTPFLPDFRRFAESCWEWSFSPKYFAGTEESPLPPELAVELPDSGELLRPTYAVAEREHDPAKDASPWQLLVLVLPPGEDFDRAPEGAQRSELTHASRFERMLRKTKVRAGLLWNGYELRLVSAPHGESSGWIDFRVADLRETSGRSMCAALRLLLNQRRLLTQPKKERFSTLLEESRKYQNAVSERLAEQVLHALYELLRGFQSAHDASKQKLLHAALSEHPDEVYRGLLTVLLRLVFLLYAEERGMLPSEDETFLAHYSLAGLFDRLRADAALHPDTMHLRYGAWAQLLVLFRLVYDGAVTDGMKLPRRHGVLFDPERFPFLEGRLETARQSIGSIDPPLVPDGTIFRVLEKLLVLDGERISYRALDVEQIGSVYETMMGFRLETASGRSIAIKAAKKGGAPTTIDLQALLAEPGTKRRKWLEERCERKPSDSVAKAIAAAASVEELHAALLPIVDAHATPDLAPPSSMILQPSEERRRSGSHYTPRSLTEPIVRTTLEPILERLRGEGGQPPRPEQILELKVCDPAMGSGAFLVEACRQLGDALVASWHAHHALPRIPPDEDEVVYARRLIAQRCLYGVDKNPVAVDLAKVSLWLVTLAKDHSLTFVDHALRHGDSLVGLTRRQLEAGSWDDSARSFSGLEVQTRLAKVAEIRRQIREAGENVSDAELYDLWDEAQHELSKVRLIGDLIVAAFFEGKNAKERESLRREYVIEIVNGTAERHLARLEEWRRADLPLAPFHWELELQEVFTTQNPGFSAAIGNPPFMGGMKISSSLGTDYRDYLAVAFVESGNRMDLAAYFLRTAFSLISQAATLGLVTTNTIAQGDTREGGLSYIARHGGAIYSAQPRVAWPGQAAVIVSLLWICKGSPPGKALLNGREVQKITSYLFSAGTNSSPETIQRNKSIAFMGIKTSGKGFIFEDGNDQGAAGTTRDAMRMLSERPGYDEILKPYIGGDEVNSDPNHAPRRFAIHFDNRPLDACRSWPELLEILRQKVQPEREKKERKVYRERWWLFAERQPGLQLALQGLRRTLACARHQPHWAITFLASGCVYSEALNVFALESYAAFCALQSRPHEIWARFFGSTLEDRLRYTPSDCFETFPFPKDWETHPVLEAAGKTYYEFRAALMVKNNEGLTKTYNRFHDPDERDPEIAKLRELHEAMDRAVLEAYGWSDVPTRCEFLLDYEIDEEEWGKKKKPYRYRWPDEVRDEVLARLLELNAQRAAEEKRLGLTKKKAAPRKAKKDDDNPTPAMF